MNLLVSFSVFPLKTDTGLSSSITDFQMHKYGKRLLIDGYYQDYRGFFTQREQNGKKAYTLFPDLAVKRWGLDGTYVLRHRRLSLRAAFEQSEKQQVVCCLVVDSITIRLYQMLPNNRVLPRLLITIK